jgi:hypothetical protein
MPARIAAGSFVRSINKIVASAAAEMALSLHGRQRKLEF